MAAFSVSQVVCLLHICAQYLWESPSYKHTSWIGSEPTLMSSFHINYPFKVLYLNEAAFLSVWGLRLSHANWEGRYICHTGRIIISICMQWPKCKHLLLLKWGPGEVLGFPLREDEQVMILSTHIWNSGVNFPPFPVLKKSNELIRALYFLHQFGQKHTI